MKNLELQLKEIQAIYFDKDAIKEPPYKLFRLDQTAGRMYYEFDKDGKPSFYLSATTVCSMSLPTSPHLITWMSNYGIKEAERIVDEQSDYGVLMHICCAELALRETYDLDILEATVSTYLTKVHRTQLLLAKWTEDLKKDILGFARFMLDYDVKVIAAEVCLRSKMWRVAGALDFVFEMNDRLYTDKTPKEKRIRVNAITDVKSGRKGFYEGHIIQLGIYRKLWNENYPEIPIVSILNWRPKNWRKEPSYTIKGHRKAPELAKVEHCIASAHIENDKSEKMVTLVGGKINLKTGLESNYKTLTLDEHIKGNKKEAPKDTQNA